MISRLAPRLWLAGMTVLLPVLVLAGWKLAHALAERRPLVATLSDGRTGPVRFTSYSAQWSDLNTGAFRKRAVEVRGELLLPERSDIPVPAAIFLHGSDGLTAHQYRYAKSFLEWGLAVFLIDSFTTRGVSDTVGDPSAVTPHSMLIDAYQALALLQTHPDVDPQRIAIVGWSKGGMVADWASRVRYRTMLSAHGSAFAAHVAFYPWCGEQHLPVQLTGAPLLYLVGARDDWTGAAPCIDYVARVREAGFRAKLALYPYAEHGFDYPGRFRRYLGGAISWAKCSYVWGEADFRVVSSGETRPWTQLDSYLERCTSRGVHVGSNALARREAGQELQSFLFESLALGRKHRPADKD